MNSHPEGSNNLPSEASSRVGNSAPSALSLFLHPGIGIKRWTLILGIGGLFIALGFGFLMAVPLSGTLLTVSRYVTLFWLPPLARGFVFLLLGVLLVVLGATHLYGMMMEGALGGRETKRLLNDLYQYRTRIRGPKIVAIGGGTGLATLLRGLKEHTRHITAVVTVADDGGSSGRLRRDLAIPPPGDARNCLVALSDVEPLMERLMQYRFSNGEGIEGHSLGNLFLAALTDMEGGFDQGLEAAAQLLGVNGRVLPSTVAANVVLSGETVHGEVVHGESNVGMSEVPLRRLWLEPEDLEANPEVIVAVREADIIVIGPGSLYTSVVPNFLIAGLSEAVQASHAPKVFVCNVATQPGETDGYGVAEHPVAFAEHSGVSVTHLLVNQNAEELTDESDQKVILPAHPSGFTGRYVTMDLVDETSRTRHDPGKLARAVIDIAKR